MFGVDTSIIIAIISLIGSLITAMLVRASNKKINNANIRKTNAETDKVIYEIQNQAIYDLQKQINQLKLDIEEMRKQEHIHIQEKIRLEEKIFNLRTENNDLRKNLDLSNIEISSLNEQINILRKDLSKIKINHA